MNNSRRTSECEGKRATRRVPRSSPPPSSPEWDVGPVQPLHGHYGAVIILSSRRNIPGYCGCRKRSGGCRGGGLPAGFRGIGFAIAMEMDVQFDRYYIPLRHAWHSALLHALRFKLYRRSIKKKDIWMLVNVNPLCARKALSDEN